MKFTGTIPSLTPVQQKKIAVVNKLNASGFSNGHWEFPEQMGGLEYTGFVYAIYDSVLNRSYLGKKMYREAGKLNKGKESDWKKYASSSPVIAEFLKERPKEEFEFICLEQYRTKGTLSYSETWTLCFVEAPTNRCWYNTRIEAVSWPVKEGVTQRHKDRLQEVINKTKKV